MNNPGAPPVIDISVLTDSGDPAAAACIDTIHHACTGTGFFIAVGHGLDVEMEAVFDAAHSFFALSQRDKEQVPYVDRYGFVPQTKRAIDRDRKSGNNEYLDVGLADEVPLPPLPGFEGAVRSYQAAALDAGTVILRALATGLGTDSEFFAARMADPQCRLRFLHYPPVEPDQDGVLPVPTLPHTDYGAITMLATDGVPGLEVKPIGAGWIPVTAPAGSLVINLGDMLARWTNDVYRSNPHRVVGPADGERFSIPFFVNPDPATIVECIPECVTKDRPRRYGPVTAGDFLASRIDSAAEPYVDPREGPVRRIDD
jgi:isopenicillin N synthase-like dioxygenase